MNAVQQELRRLEQRGKLSPSVVVQAAKDPRSVLHPHFEWDDTECGRRYRLEQARELIRIQITVQPANHNQRTYISIIEDRGKGLGYTNTTALSGAELRRRMAEEAFYELDILRRKYLELREFAPVWDAIDSVRNVRSKRRA